MPSLNIYVCIGSYFEECRLEEYKKIISHVDKHEFIFFKTSNLLSYINSADLFISSGGISKYESAFLGTPNLIFSQGELESIRSNCYAKTGAAIAVSYDPVVNRERFANLIFNLVINKEARTQLSSKGSQLIDGHGAKRVVNSICELFSRNLTNEEKKL